MQAMVFNDQEKLDNEAAGKTFPAINQWMKLMNGKSIRLVVLCQQSLETPPLNDHA